MNKKDSYPYLGGKGIVLFVLGKIYCRNPLGVFFLHIFPCLNIFAEHKFEYRADKRLNEEQLGEKCKREVKAYQLQPVGE